MRPAPRPLVRPQLHEQTQRHKHNADPPPLQRCAPTFSSWVQLEASGMRSSMSPRVRQVAGSTPACSCSGGTGPATDDGSAGSVGRPVAGENCTGAGVTEAPTPSGRGGRVSATAGAAWVGAGSVKKGWLWLAAGDGGAGDAEGGSGVMSCTVAGSASGLGAADVLLPVAARASGAGANSRAAAERLTGAGSASGAGAGDGVRGALGGGSSSAAGGGGGDCKGGYHQ